MGGLLHFLLPLLLVTLIVFLLPWLLFWCSYFRCRIMWCFNLFTFAYSQVPASTSSPGSVAVLSWTMETSGLAKIQIWRSIFNFKHKKSHFLLHYLMRPASCRSPCRPHRPNETCAFWGGKNSIQFTKQTEMNRNDPQIIFDIQRLL